MASEYMGPLPDPKNPYQPAPANQALNTNVGEDRSRYAEHASGQREAEPSYREHVSGQLVLHPTDAPHFSPAYNPPYAAQQPVAQAHPSYPQPFQPQGYGQGYAPPQQPFYPPYGYMPQPQVAPQYGQYPGYNPAGQRNVYAAPGAYGYGAYGYPYQQKPRRDGYLLGMNIAALVCSGLVLLSGLISTLFVLLIAIAPAKSSTASAVFSGLVMLIALSIAGLIGGSFCLYHSIRSLLKKRSGQLQLPAFWIFLALYIGVLAVGFLVRNNEGIFSVQPLIIALIMAAGVLPALTVFALAVRRLHIYRDSRWTTTWRRFTVAIVSGATSAILFASIFELVLSALVAIQLNSFALSNPDTQFPKDPKEIAVMFILAAIIAPLVEEGVKPLAVVSLIGRINSTAEAFILGMACGIGFDLVETSGYISQGYHNWLDVAIERSSAGLLHGFGAGMVALGWYLLFHKNAARHHILLGLACGTYAVLQHAIWNASTFLILLPAPIGPYLENGVIPIGSYPMPAILLIYIVETILMLLFFFYVTGKLRKLGNLTPPAEAARRGFQPAQAVPVAARA